MPDLRTAGRSLLFVLNEAEWKGWCNNFICGERKPVKQQELP
jgi:hypothetical protein